MKEVTTMAEILWGAEKITIARKLNGEELTAFKEGAYVKPGSVAIVFKNGSVDEIVTEKSQKQDNKISWGKKLFQSIGGNSSHVVMVHTAPVSLPFRVSVLTLDQQKIDGSGSIWLTSIIGEDTDKEELHGMGGLFAQDEVNLADIMEKLGVDFLSRVFQPLVEGVRCEEIRSNVGLLRDIERLARQELGGLLLAWGLRIERISVAWDFSVEEKAILSQLERERSFEEEKFSAQNRQSLREIQLEAELSEKRRRAELDAELAKQRQSIELERKKAESELERREFEMIQHSKLERMKIQHGSDKDAEELMMSNSITLNTESPKYTLPVADIHFCPQCGQAVAPEWDLCPYCAINLKARRL